MKNARRKVLIKKTGKKLKSESGASISFGLLIFLICAVVCSIVLTAATAAAGRMSKVAQYDQQYYSLVSAAELFKEQLNGKTVTIVSVKSESSVVTYTNETPAEPVPVGEAETKVYLLEDLSAAEITDGMLDSRVQIEGSDASGTALRYKSMANDAAAVYALSETFTSRTLELESDTAGALELDADPLAVQINETIKNGADIALVLKNGNDSADAQSLALDFAADITESTETNVTEGERENVTVSGENVTYEVTVTTTVKTITTFTWRLAGVSS